MWSVRPASQLSQICSFSKILPSAAFSRPFTSTTKTSSSMIENPYTTTALGLGNFGS